jgi:hypothetical protein
MRGFIVMIFMGLGLLLQFGGGLALVGLLIYGVYAIFAKSLAVGLMLIGAAVVGGWVVKIASGLLMAAGVGAASIGAKDD